jgi:hypothetical protein
MTLDPNSINFATTTAQAAASDPAYETEIRAGGAVREYLEDVTARRASSLFPSSSGDHAQFGLVDPLAGKTEIGLFGALEIAARIPLSELMSSIAAAGESARRPVTYTLGG